MNSFMANPDKIERKWYVVDASEYTLGRLASDVYDNAWDQEAGKPDCDNCKTRCI